MSTNNSLVQHLKNTDALYSSNIVEAFENIDRVDFVLNPVDSDVYEDYPLPIGHGQTISQPTTVAMMLEMLKPKKGQKILDIGSGSGWTTALLSYIVGSDGYVTGVERVGDLVKFGNKNLGKYGFKNTKIIQSGDKLGVVGEKFDCILVSAAADEFPKELAEQLKVGGKLVIPIKSSIYEITKNENGKLEGSEHYGFTFVPLIF
ncbi:protein-L-isoaspartate O-methyltransferase family protein [Candidatus Sulfurimonas baltica]|uniref:Protein-L-isoaspartate O-methyltransferase n=1 Tax=Candidatus Sulfurimonas baltica TaxID=2740404 RepID=A0A7S7LV13_9BACT|nr:protein-L-isoaspartate O-methyltransferase [Candidatus Sulfurimonas baltica]QOY51946.1 protein-L-isoaspartate O-methyltransferase [Candidatus Sulfurimonas baltica]